eukprot:3932360-Rhodomonas_salina.1
MHYALRGGTEIGYGGAAFRRRGQQCTGLITDSSYPTLPSYALPMPCPVLTYPTATSTSY